VKPDGGRTLPREDADNNRFSTSTRAIPRGFAASLDQLMTLELRPAGFMDGVIPPLYEAARQLVGEPLAWRAASRLRDALGPGKVALFLTGHWDPISMPLGETDGPLGAVILARATHRLLGAHPLILCDEPIVPVVVELCKVAGMSPVTKQVTRELIPVSHRVHVLSLNGSEKDAHGQWNQIRSLFDVQSVVTVEKIGPNHLNVLHSGLGRDMSKHLARADILVESARQAGVLTIGIGDLGNEIGFGRIADVVREVTPYGETCRCPCGSGTACSTDTDELVVAGSSNWGAYAIAAALAVQVGDASALHQPEDEVRLIRAACRAGCVDGISIAPSDEVDGVSEKRCAAWVGILDGLVENSLAQRSLARVAFEDAADAP